MKATWPKLSRSPSWRSAQLWPGRLHGDRRLQGDLAKVEQAGEAELQLKTEREDRVDAGNDADERPEAAACERVHMTLARPKRPCGRTISAPARIAKATTGLST